MRYLAGFLLIGVLAGCASFDTSDDRHLTEYRDWYKNPCSRCY